MDNVLIMFSNWRVFKKDIEPVWEHPENRDGGKWVIRGIRVNFAAEKDSIPDEFVRKFLSLLIHMVTGQLGFEDEICGAQLSVRPTGLVFSVWNKNSNDEKIIDIIKLKLKEITQISIDQISYQSHSGSIKNSAQTNPTHDPESQQKKKTQSKTSYPQCEKK